MNQWTQNYNPIGFWPASTLAAGLPVFVLLGLLASGKAGAARAALAGLFTASLVAVVVFGMPARLVAASACVGVVFAVFRIIWLILAAVFLYDIAVETGRFDVMKHSIAAVTDDRRIQAVLVAFCFGAFLEGAAGFGAPVAIAAAFLVGLGFKPFQAAVLCLIANTAPVAWGAIGTPIRTLATVTNLNVEALSATAGRIIPPLSLLIPTWLVVAVAGWAAAAEVAPALIVVGGTFALAQWAWSNYVGFELVDLVSAVAGLLAGILWMRVWQPRRIWRFDHDLDDAPVSEITHNNSESPINAVSPVRPASAISPVLTTRVVARAWMPFALLTLTVLVWGLPAIKPLGLPAMRDTLDRLFSHRIEMPGLHLAVTKGAAVSGHATPTAKDHEPAVLELVPLSSTGTAVFLAAVASGLALGMRPARMAVLFGLATYRMRGAFAAILAMLALGFVTKYSGMDAVLGLAFTRTGPLYPIFGTMLGWLGVALTGSDTSSNVLFGNLQTITARRLGLSPVLMAAANTTGGVMGKMIDAQSIVVAAAATGENGREGDILRAVLLHSIALALAVAAIVCLYAYALKWMVVEM